METYEGGLAAQSVTHYYGGADTTPKRQEVSKTKSCKGEPEMACKKKSGSKSKKK